jgi:hypothetical protein
MNLDEYATQPSSDFLTYEFYSNGPRGTIKKVIEFRKLNTPDREDEYYNLAFGDYNAIKGKIDDTAVSNNKDAYKILATVASAVIIFTKHYPKASVFVQGSTPSRTRLYIMGISKYLNQVMENFEVWGALSESKWEFFRKNQPYIALLAKRK